MEKENGEEIEIRIDEDEEKENITFETAENFDELYALIEKFGKVIGSNGKEYNSDSLIGKIKTFRARVKDFQEREGITQLTKKEKIRNLIEGNLDLHDLTCRITRSKELRNRVVDLAIDEVINRAVSKKNKDKK